MNEKIYKTMSRTGACSIAVRDHNPCNRCCCRSADDRQWKQTAEKKV